MAVQQKIYIDRYIMSNIIYTFFEKLGPFFKNRP